MSPTHFLLLLVEGKGSATPDYKLLMACVATWSFGLEAVEVAAKLIGEGKNCVDVVENAINGMF